MKVDFENNVIYVYFYEEKINLNDMMEVNNKIKKIIVRLIKRYKLNISGYNKVTVYHNSNFGLVLKIERMYNTISVTGIIDLKVIIYKDVDMYLEFDDYCFIERPKNLIVKNNKYYLNLENIDNIYKYIELGKLIIKKINK